jgi:hypothetical protein
VCIFPRTKSGSIQAQTEIYASTIKNIDRLMLENNSVHKVLRGNREECGKGGVKRDTSLHKHAYTHKKKVPTQRETEACVQIMACHYCYWFFCINKRPLGDEKQKSVISTVFLLCIGKPHTSALLPMSISFDLLPPAFILVETTAPKEREERLTKKTKGFLSNVNQKTERQ